jgi:signal transduction histidine kinase
MSGPGKLDHELRLAATTIGETVDRGRQAADRLRADDSAELADLIDELCDDVERVRRQVTRLGLDLHDEGMQDVAAMRNDLQLFRRQLSGALIDSEDTRRIVYRVDDFLARTERLDTVLRDVAVSAAASAILERPLSVTIEDEVDLHSGDCTITSHLDPRLDDVVLTDSQRITIVRIVQAALANVELHSGATRASVTARISTDSVEIEVLDDGQGFDVDEARRSASAHRRLGLLSMRERVRLLGGTFDVTSRDGGPTCVFAKLPARTGL